MNDDLQNLIERYRRAHDSRLFAPLADAYRKNGEVDKAIEVLEKGLERFPQYASAHVILGKCFYDKGATARAKSEFHRVLELDEENLVALKYMGDILVAEDKRSEAGEYYRRILAVDPKNEEVALSLKEIEASFVVKEINLGDTKSIRDERPKELATMTLAGIYAAQGYYNKALNIFREVLIREPGNSEAKEMVAKLESIINSTEVERDKAFQEEVLTISLNDISEEIASSTAGHGGAEAPVPDVSEGESIHEPADVEPASGEKEAAVEIPEAPPAEAEEPSNATPDAPEEHGEGDDMARFRDWLKKLKKD
ncbi:MAG: tetratricopeptide repeat protein [Candidatus Krumholzibacteria bacterium]|nr:tetratricopeptide repeat protein [Candidatus Krumholzibacteria bacterium]